ncbi:thioredoxin-dependent thiol peroxidase [Bernardetia sp. Wsw4-3y2]|uniref:thioredoxin-dependent thiol peroxidase n=1 Tax=unclassified Bernardetia TaxID=2647129 RepID=UPI0030D13E53
MELKKGDKAPEFTSHDQNGHEVKLSQLKGKKVILYFYPKDDTPGCTAQACNLRDNYTDLQKQGYVVLGVSKDDAASHKKFVEKYDLPFPLLVDEDHAINEAYGVWKEKNMFGKKYMGTQRTTFVIDEEGKIAEVIKKVNTKEHAEQIVK